MIQDGEATKTPIPENDLAVQMNPENLNATSNSTDSGLISSIFHSVTNYLFENGTGAFF